jgi:hypothetical protein
MKKKLLKHIEYMKWEINRISKNKRKYYFQKQIEVANRKLSKLK